LKIRTVGIVLAAAMLAGCAAAPPPVTAPQGETRYLVDPRIGWNAEVLPATERRFDEAWRIFLAGEDALALARLSQIQDYPPAVLAQAAIDIRQRNFPAAHAIIDPLLQQQPQYIAAEIYAAELDIAETHIRSAYDRYRALMDRTGVPPTVAARFSELQTRLFDQLYGAALNAAPDQAVPLLREALQVMPGASAARLLLVQKLIASRHFDDARHEIDPLLNSAAADQPDVQEALAEIDVGRGRYQDAITRYERLTHRDATGRYARRLEEIKALFAAANLPPQVAAAMNAETITRTDLAVLAYWNVASIRFAQNVPPPPIATDITDAPGRDELIRAIALGIFQVDAVTRRVNPDQVVTGSGLARAAARILILRGAACAQPVGPAVTPDVILSACGIANPAAGPAADLPVSGQTAAGAMAQVDKAIAH